MFLHIRLRILTNIGIFVAAPSINAFPVGRVEIIRVEAGVEVATDLTRNCGRRRKHERDHKQGDETGSRPHTEISAVGT